jgi:iron complex outermembrane receptor protein
LGLVATPAAGWNLTVDAYVIELNDRIMDSGGIGGPLAAAAISANGAVVPADAAGNAFAQFFTNGVDTRTRGIDLHVDTRTEHGDLGRVRWAFDGGYNKTDIRRIHDAPTALQAAGVALLDDIQISNLTTATPHTKLSLSAVWSRGPWEVTLRETRYGASTQVQWGVNFAGLYANEVKAAFITDLNIGYDIKENLRLDIGANNLFNSYPNETDPQARLNFDKYSHLSPYGINGGYYYAKLTSTF